MAEPISAFPETTPPDLAAKREAVPWPTTLDPAEEPVKGLLVAQQGSFFERFGPEFEQYYRKVQDSLEDAWDRSRRRLRYISNEHPVKVVVGVAIASFITGAALRIWRNHE